LQVAISLYEEGQFFFHSHCWVIMSP
jgi:hypothetical protein